eukprot:jgi/Hompol1/3157/HPOL_003142-RA
MPLPATDRIVLAKFAALPKRGKPVHRSASQREWTVLAGIVMQQATGHTTGQFEPDSGVCVALGTGLKCLPLASLPSDGSAVADSHAEVICRRNWVRFMLGQMLKALDGKQSIVELARPAAEDATSNTQKPFRLKSGVRFHLYISQSPYPVVDPQASTARKRKAAECPEPSTHKATALEAPAELSSGSTENATVIRGRNNFQATGRLRTKPGRPDAPPSTSMSCSDKIAKWNVLGLGGALLSLLIDPIHLASIMVGDLFDEESLRASLIDRCGSIAAPEIRSAETLSWCKGEESEAIVQGRKQGASMRNGVWPEKSKVLICKAQIAKLFVKVVNALHKNLTDTETAQVGQSIPIFEQSQTLTYFQLKQRATAYQQAKRQLYDGALRGWFVNPSELE